ncbi:hypothetical protein ElyMa_005508600 [Elysia marginata]|uniref:DDE-1 domain-containing protein n=1 Tax=Elysia marginata TaxID=1093978 RepID=A0AAV4EWG8_9GAST|nr:hypothetical protein ElyMa_005508600 [Elysia marginata]
MKRHLKRREKTRKAQPLTSDSNDQEWRKVAVYHLTWGTIWHRKAGIVLFTTQQIRDIWRFCCSSPPGEGTVLGVDKTFNLGQLHVTHTVFKHLGIVRPTTNTHPIFIGPTLIHGNSDRKTYSTFFNFIKQEFEDAPKDPVIGSDEEMAIRIAVIWVFFMFRSKVQAL